MKYIVSMNGNFYGKIEDDCYFSHRGGALPITDGKLISKSIRVSKGSDNRLLLTEIKQEYTINYDNMTMLREVDGTVFKLAINE